MHQIILLTALTATSGLFGGGRHCGGCGHRGVPMTGHGCVAPVAYYQPCAGYAYRPQYAYSYPQPCPSCGAPAYSAPATPAPGYSAPQLAPVTPQAAPTAPAAAPTGPQAVPPAPPAPPVPPAAPRAALAPQAGPSNPAAYYYYPVAPACAPGNCPGR